MTIKQNGLAKILGCNITTALLIVLLAAPFLAVAGNVSENIKNYNSNISENVLYVGGRNNVYGNGFYQDNYVNNTIYVTPGQEYKDKVEVTGSYLYPSNVIVYDTISVYANRKKSKDVVTWVKTQMSNNHIPWNSRNAMNNGNGTPDMLNFAIQGDLQIANGINPNTNLTFKYYLCPHIIFGQGHSSARNIWWIFSNTDQTGSNTSHYITCYPYTNNDTTQPIDYSSPVKFGVSFARVNELILSSPWKQ